MSMGISDSVSVDPSQHKDMSSDHSSIRKNESMCRKTSRKISEFIKRIILWVKHVGKSIRDFFFADRSKENRKAEADKKSSSMTSGLLSSSEPPVSPKPSSVPSKMPPPPSRNQLPPSPTASSRIASAPGDSGSDRSLSIQPSSDLESEKNNPEVGALDSTEFLDVVEGALKLSMDSTNLQILDASESGPKQKAGDKKTGSASPRVAQQEVSGPSKPSPLNIEEEHDPEDITASTLSVVEEGDPEESKPIP